MAWIIVCLGVIIAGFVMWDSIHDQLPEMLRLPQNTSALMAESETRSPAATVGPANWAVAADTQNLRASREFQSPVIAGSTHYYPPIMHLSCYNAGLFAWIDTGLQPMQVKGSPGVVAVRVNGGQVEHWMKGDGARIVASDPARLIQALSKGPTLTLELAFEEAPKQTLSIGTNGMDSIKPYLDACRSTAGIH